MKFKMGQMIFRPNFAHKYDLVYYYIMENVINGLIVGQRLDTYNYTGSEKPDEMEIFYLGHEKFQLTEFGDPVY